MRPGQSRAAGAPRADPAPLEELLRTLEEILAFSRTETGRERRKEELVDAVRVVRDIESIVRALADERGLAFDVHAPRRPVELVTDVGKLKHILMNLLSNALKFTVRGRIELELEREGDRVVFKVHDTGRASLRRTRSGSSSRSSRSRKR